MIDVRRIVFVLVILVDVLSGGSYGSADEPPHYDVRYYIDGDGNRQPTMTVADWERRRRNVLQRMQEVMGQLPDQATRAAPTFEVLEETELANQIWRQHIRYEVEPSDWVSAYLLWDKSEDEKRPAMLCLHQTTSIGKQEPAGMGGSSNLHYGLELAQRGYVVFIPDYPSFGDYPYDFDQHSEWKSGSLKAVWNNMRAVDLMQSLSSVDGEKVGVIGHSLGGHNSIFTAVFDQRLKVVVTSCGFTRFHKYYEGNLRGWTSPRYMPAIDQVYHCDPNQVPFDFPELVAAIAPRGFFTNSPQGDDNFDCQGVRETIAAAEFVYKLYEKPENLRAIYPDCQHDFPTEAREQAYRFLDQHLKP